MYIESEFALLEANNEDQAREIKTLVAALEDILESYKKASPRLYDLIVAAEQALAPYQEE